MKRIIVMKNASKEEMEDIRIALENKDLVIVGGDIQVYVIKDNELFEVVNDLKKIGEIKFEEVKE